MLDDNLRIRGSPLWCFDLSRRFSRLPLFLLFLEDNSEACCRCRSEDQLHNESSVKSQVTSERCDGDDFFFFFRELETENARNDQVQHRPSASNTVPLSLKAALTFFTRRIIHKTSDFYQHTSEQKDFSESHC